MSRTHALDLQDCARIVALAEHGSFAAAARALGLSQPALTRAVQSLERRLRVEVFHRSSTGVRPTEVGLLLLERSRDLLHRARDLTRSLEQVSGTAQGEVGVAVGAYPAAMILEEALARFHRAAPAVRVQVFVGDWADVMLRLRTGQADLAVFETSLTEDDPTLEVRRLLEHQGQWVARRGHPLDRGRDPALAEILAYPVAFPTRFPPRILEPMLRQRPAGGPPGNQLASLLCPDLRLLLRLVARTDYVTVTAPLLVRAELEAGTLVRLGGEPWMTSRYGIHRARQRDHNPFATMLAEAFAEADAQFAAEAAAYLDVATARPSRARTRSAGRPPSSPSPARPSAPRGARRR